MPRIMSDYQRREIVDEMPERSINGLLTRELHSQMRWSRDRSTMSNVWHSYGLQKLQQMSRMRVRRQVVRLIAASAGVSCYIVAPGTTTPLFAMVAAVVDLGVDPSAAYAYVEPAGDSLGNDAGPSWLCLLPHRDDDGFETPAQVCVFDAQLEFIRATVCNDGMYKVYETMVPNTICSLSTGHITIAKSAFAPPKSHSELSFGVDSDIRPGHGSTVILPEPAFPFTPLAEKHCQPSPLVRLP
ncbi:hypothetical protein PHYPSEUDO_004214 [Phytophthora pseudosyringae]|uniref:Uncharacterized protein n=1 Tax=Phytophthora pseudosyringae TaxID=221518 RepID=A0A8T1VRW7_9STRA|nr:hypothetical protein PHYPSEUDO_004214 [Phytophthora pseudosyringae]